MASYFRISVHRNGENLHVKLMGDFDGTSAHALLKALRSKSHCSSRIFVHTNCLKQIHPFGVNVFHDNLDILNNKPLTLIFTGEHASQLAPWQPLPSDIAISILPLDNKAGRVGSPTLSIQGG